MKDMQLFSMFEKRNIMISDDFLQMTFSLKANDIIWVIKN
jgi:hypothetical protein